MITRRFALLGLGGVVARLSVRWPLGHVPAEPAIPPMEPCQTDPEVLRILAPPPGVFTPGMTISVNNLGPGLLRIVDGATVVATTDGRAKARLGDDGRWVEEPWPYEEDTNEGA